MTLHLGYCTNVHAGADLDQTKANLEQYACRVKQLFSPTQPMGVGLWLSAAAAQSLLDEGQTPEFAAWLTDQGLHPFTMNGFPFGNFHQAEVKHKVYLPTWADDQRRQYTHHLIDIHAQLLPPATEGSISTLPLLWGIPSPSSEVLAACAQQLRQTAAYLAETEARTGKLIHLCLEPEPGCALQYSQDIVTFFEQHLLPGADEPTLRRHVRVCHDVCHAAVMFEDQAEVLQRYQAAGILVGKVQVSAAVLVDFEQIDPNDRAAAVEQLTAFQEPRYLHQTTIKTNADEPLTFYEDLPEALMENAWPEQWTGQWRTHFHVPIYLEKFGWLTASQSDILACLKAVPNFAPEVTHFEVETYAWGVLPTELQQPDLAAGIAQELAWFQNAVNDSTHQRVTDTQFN